MADASGIDEPLVAPSFSSASSPASGALPSSVELREFRYHDGEKVKHNVPSRVLRKSHTDTEVNGTFCDLTQNAAEDRFHLAQANATLDLFLPSSYSYHRVHSIHEPNKEPAALTQLDSRAALFCVSSALMGIAPAHPFGFSEVGLAGGVAFVLLSALVISKGIFMSVEVLRCRKVQVMADVEKVPSKARGICYVAYVAFGESFAWRVATSVILSAELWSSLVVNVVNASIVGSLLTRGMLSPQVVIVIIEVVTLPMLGAPSWLFALSAKLGLAGLVICIAVFLISASQSNVEASPTVMPGSLGISTVVGTFGIFFFSFGNAPCLNSVRNNMADTEKFPMVALGGLGISTMYYIGMGAVGYLAFGATIEQHYMGNVTHPILLALASTAIVLRVPLMSPMMTNPILSALMPLLKVESVVGTMIFKVSLLTVTALTAILFSHSVAVATALVGTSLTMTTCVFLPALLYCKLGFCKTVLDKLQVSILVLFGFFFAVAGTYYDMSMLYTTEVALNVTSAEDVFNITSLEDMLNGTFNRLPPVNGTSLQTSIEDMLNETFGVRLRTL